MTLEILRAGSGFGFVSYAGDPAEVRATIRADAEARKQAERDRLGSDPLAYQEAAELQAELWGHRRAEPSAAEIERFRNKVRRSAKLGHPIGRRYDSEDLALAFSPSELEQLDAAARAVVAERGRRRRHGRHDGLRRAA